VSGDPTPRVAGVLLAAGAARRFGSPKQLADLEGAPLVRHAVEALLAVEALDPVLVVVGANADEVAAAVEHPDVTVVRCDDWEEGMAASLRAGVAAADAAGADAALVHLADLPRVTSRVIARALDAATEGVAVRVTYDGAPGHPVVLPRRLFAAVAQLRGDAGARGLLGSAKALEAGHLADPTDVDTPETLELLRAQA
jgi:molybdenum cofactor cytidylyltransferase